MLAGRAFFFGKHWHTPAYSHASLARSKNMASLWRYYPAAGQGGQAHCRLQLVMRGKDASSIQEQLHQSAASMSWLHHLIFFTISLSLYSTTILNCVHHRVHLCAVFEVKVPYTVFHKGLLKVDSLRVRCNFKRQCRDQREGTGCSRGGKA